jgi:hypothetical protein
LINFGLYTPCSNLGQGFFLHREIYYEKVWLRFLGINFRFWGTFIWHTVFYWLRLLGLYDWNKDKQLSVKELGSGWYVYGKYDFNRNGQLTQKEFDEKIIPPAIKK